MNERNPISYQDAKIVRRVFSEKHIAINNALSYANQEKETIYVWKSPMDARDSEYTLRKRSDVLDVHSEHIVHIQPFDVNLKIQKKGRNPKSVRLNERERFLEL